jgi:hypothetical protein
VTIEIVSKLYKTIEKGLEWNNKVKIEDNSRNISRQRKKHGSKWEQKIETENLSKICKKRLTSVINKEIYLCMEVYLISLFFIERSL